MTAKGWADLVDKAAGDPGTMALLVRLLVEQDEAKHRLRQMGFGVTGTPWLQMVDEIGRMVSVPSVNGPAVLSVHWCGDHEAVPAVPPKPPEPQNRIVRGPR